jgi:hypothetical protein
VLEIPKTRDGDVNPRELIAVESRTNEDGALISMHFTSEGEVEAEITETEKRAAALIRAAEEIGGEVPRAELCEAAGIESRDSTTSDALKRAEDDGGLKKGEKHGTYQARERLGVG